MPRAAYYTMWAAWCLLVVVTLWVGSFAWKWNPDRTGVEVNGWVVVLTGYMVHSLVTRPPWKLPRPGPTPDGR